MGDARRRLHHLHAPHRLENQDLHLRLLRVLPPALPARDARRGVCDHELCHSGVE